MKIHLFGNGKMGKMIAHLAPQLGHSVTELASADVCIDFSHPSVLLDHLQIAAASKKPLVLGTTGWEEKREEALELIKKNNIGVVASPNFSIGIHLLMGILEKAASSISPFKEYEVAGIESHHRQKVDAPSGTALQIAKAIDQNFDRPEKCLFASVRAGSIPGTHSILFDSPFDTLTITHTARSREGFARGALLAGEWIRGKTGFFTFQDCMRDYK